MADCDFEQSRVHVERARFHSTVICKPLETWLTAGLNAGVLWRKHDWAVIDRHGEGLRKCQLPLPLAAVRPKTGTCEGREAAHYRKHVASGPPRHDVYAEQPDVRDLPHRIR
jgi:hypothetical protein